MEQLRHSELRALLAFIGGCYRILDFERFVQYLLTAMPELIPAAHVTYNEIDPLNSKSHNRVNTAELATREAGLLWEQFMHEHPPMAHFLAGGDPQSAVRISDFLSRRQLHDRGLYHDFYRLFDIEDALCITVPCPPPGFIGVGWHRERKFTGRERLMAGIVSPHIGQAWRNARLVSRLQHDLRLFDRGLEGVGSGIVVCGNTGKTRFTTTLARQYLSQYFGCSEALRPRLPDELVRWLRHENARLAGKAVPPVRLPLVIHKGDRRLVIRLLSNAGENLLLFEEQIAVPDKHELESLGLTRRETEVLFWVALGKTNAEIGIILSMNPLTVKKHLEHIFNKLGVRTRTAAAASALHPRPARPAAPPPSSPDGSLTFE